MNNLTLSGVLLDSPQLGYLQNEKQTPFTTFGLRFPDPKPNSTGTFPIRIYAYGKLAEEVVSRGYAPGAVLVVTGAVNIETIERKEGFKEKRAQISANRISQVLAGAAPDPSLGSTPPAPAAPPAPVAPPPVAPPPAPVAPPPPPPAPQAPPAYTAPVDDPFISEEIPF